MFSILYIICIKDDVIILIIPVIAADHIAQHVLYLHNYNLVYTVYMPLMPIAMYV